MPGWPGTVPTWRLLALVSGLCQVAVTLTYATGRGHALNGQNAMDVLHQLMLGIPWRPSAQAFPP